MPFGSNDSMTLAASVYTRDHDVLQHKSSKLEFYNTLKTIQCTHMYKMISEMSTFLIAVIFSMVVYLRWLYQHMQSVSSISKENRFLLNSLRCTLMMCANIRIHYGPMVTIICLRFQYLIVMIVQTYRMILNIYDACQVHYVECVSKIKSILSIIFHAIYGAVYKQLTHFAYNDCENMCILSYYHHHQSKVWPICHYLWLGHETKICGVCISTFLFLHNMWGCMH